MPTKLRTEVLEASLNVVCCVLDLSNAGDLFQRAPWIMQATLPLLSRADLPHGITTSVHALLGEAIRLKPEVFLPTFSEWFPILAKGVQPSADCPVNTRNNAVWAVGRVALMAPSQALTPWADDLAKAMADVIRNIPPQGGPDDGDQDEARNDDQYLRITW